MSFVILTIWSVRFNSTNHIYTAVPSPPLHVSKSLLSLKRKLKKSSPRTPSQISATWISSCLHTSLFEIFHTSGHWLHGCAADPVVCWAFRLWPTFSNAPSRICFKSLEQIPKSYGFSVLITLRKLYSTCCYSYHQRTYIPTSLHSCWSSFSDLKKKKF